MRFVIRVIKCGDTARSENDFPVENILQEKDQIWPRIANYP